MLTRFEAMCKGNFLQTLERSRIWRDTGHLLPESHLLGTGLGTFEQAFRPYQTALVNDTIDHAHNDYIEFASETRLVGAALLFIPIFYALFRMTAGSLDDHRRYRRAVTHGCIGSTLALLIHSAVDFNLQLPANALIFAVILGIGYRVSCLEPRREASPKANATV